ncbi:MAG TPA: SpoIIE family protein phosphatase [Bryobacteraceae bacterium]|nr:SpoIIE family protein phosphatase [Bryobacteraceae bacterium]
MRNTLPAGNAGYWPHFCLALVFAVAMITQGTFTVDVYRDLTNDYPEPPLYLGSPWPAIVWVSAEAEAAGLRKGDRVVVIDGRTPAGLKDVREPMRRKKPGEYLAVSVERAGQVSGHQVKLAPVGFAGTMVAWLYAIGIWTVLPWFCLALGFWVAAVRIRDPRAWMVLGILAGMSQIGRPGILDPYGWGWLGVLAKVFHEETVFVWGLCMLLFGLYFPQRWRFDRYLPWFKWVLIVPTVGLLVWDAIRNIGYGVALGETDRLIGSLVVPGWAVIVELMLVMSFFFIGLQNKLREQSQHADDRRRIRVLYFGCTVAMTPMFLLYLFDAVLYRRQPGDADGVLLAIALACMFLFPVTLAYVIVVQRALDVRMFIRQGVQYALARGGIRVITAGLIIAIIVIALSLLEGPHVSRPQKLTFLAVGIILVLRLRDLAERVRRWVDRRFFREAYDSERILSDLSEQVRTILDKQALLQTVTQKLAQSLHVERIAVMLQDGPVFRPSFATGYSGALDLEFPAGTEAVARLERTREPVTVEQAGDEHGPLAQLDAQLLLPLATKKELLGFISLGPKKSEEPYSAADTSLLRTVAAQTGLALENSRLSEAIAVEVTQRELLHREIEIAREVQERLFPQNLPAVPALEYAGHCRPARGVGGDYYDFLALSSGRLGLAIGDVSGKGVPAALLMASLQASVRGQSQVLRPDGTPDVAGLIENVNRLVFDASPQNRYATFFYAQFEPATRRLVYTNGGHNAPMLIRGEEVLRLEIGGPPVGLFRASKYEQAELDLRPGDLLILFTDGVSEAENPAEEEWGEEALVKAVRGCSGLPPSEMIASIMQAADAFASGAPQHDDITLVVARVLAG